MVEDRNKGEQRSSEKRWDGSVEWNKERREERKSRERWMKKVKYTERIVRGKLNEEGNKSRNHKNKIKKDKNRGYR